MKNQLLRAFRKSWFYVNKMHLVLPFVFLLITNATMAAYGFLMYSVLLTLKILTQKVPLDPLKRFSHKTVVYKKTDVGDLKLDIWYPRSKKKTYPLVLFAHGGGWILGFRNQPNNVSWCRYLASKGFCAASVGYRLGIVKSIDEIMNDFSDALDYVRDHSDRLSIDVNRLFLMGLSAGGHLALLFSAFHSYHQDKERLKGVKGVVAYYTPTQLKGLFEPDSKSFFARFATFVTLRGSPAVQEELYGEYSPIQWVSEKMIPTLLVHGKEDTTVPFSSSVNFARRLKSLNVPYRFLVHKHGNHTFEFTRKDYRTKWILEQTVKFIAKHISGTP